MDGWGHEFHGTVLGPFAQAARRWPDAVFLDIEGECITYREFWTYSDRLAAGLQALGVGPGDTVLGMLDNGLDPIAAWVAANKLGAVWVPINTALKGTFLAHVASDAGAAVALVEEAYYGRFAAVIDRLPALAHLVVRGLGARSPEGMGGVAVSGLDRLVSAEPLRAEDHDRPWDLTCLIYTAGTTGPSKGCMLSHNAVRNLAHAALARKSLGPGDVYWTPLPLFHLNACASALQVASVGATLAIVRRFSLSRFWGEIRRTGATYAMLLGAMIRLVAQADDSPEMLACRGQLKAVGGAPYTAEDIRIFKERFGIRQVGSGVYGLTEAAPLTSLGEGEEGPPGCSGRRNPWFDVRIVDDEDRELPPGVPGEVIARPRRPHVMFEGYWRRPADTLAVMRNLWFHTGDIGLFDADGYFWFKDRKKDYLRRRGENISSVELENAFLEHPDVLEVCAHAVPSDLSEDDVKITVVPRPGSSLTEEALLRWSFDRVPFFAIPRYIEFREELPRNAVGRVLKYQLRDEGVTPNTFDREAAGIDVPKQ